MYDLRFILTHTDGFNQDDVVACPRQDATDLLRRRRKAALMTASRHASDIDARIERMFVHSDAVSQQRPAGLGAGDVDRENGNGHPLATIGLHKGIDEGALSRPGITSHPYDGGPAEIRRQPPKPIEAVRMVTLHQCHETGQGSDVAGSHL